MLAATRASAIILISQIIRLSCPISDKIFVNFFIWYHSWMEEPTSLLEEIASTNFFTFCFLQFVHCKTWIKAQSNWSLVKLWRNSEKSWRSTSKQMQRYRDTLRDRTTSEVTSQSQSFYLEMRRLVWCLASCYQRAMRPLWDLSNRDPSNRDLSNETIGAHIF